VNRWWLRPLVRSAAALVLPVAVPFLCVLLLWALPGDPASIICPPETCSGTEELARRWNLDQGPTHYFLSWAGGVAQGGFVSGWIDAAMAGAAMSQSPGMTPMSLEMKVSFFAPARPGLVIAEGWIERAGRSTCFAEGRLLNAAGDVIAKASSTIRLIPTDAVQATTKRAMA
jgi:uncharacterized protein (TIGR00369 family)